ncbi:hypothetical protein OKW96_16055 [Sphingobacterium sp. KU25419]|nr:hypothetical protein OKW96_16055 [Sphingobacterium sp. KU25419]
MQPSENSLFEIFFTFVHLANINIFTHNYEETILLSPLFLLASCAQKIVDFALKKNGILDETTVLRSLKYADKELVFLDMMHLGKKEYYNDVTSKIDSLQKVGYFVFHEGLYLRRSDRVINENDTNYLKFRRITNLDPLVEYSKTKPFSDYISKYNLIDQPDYVNMGITAENSKPVDLSIARLISEFEKQKGPVALTQCDYDTKLGSGSYSCGKVDNEARNLLMEDIAINKRNENIVDQIKQSDKRKILIVYGKKHYDGVKKLLEQ